MKRLQTSLLSTNTAHSVLLLLPHTDVHSHSLVARFKLANVGCNGGGEREDALWKWVPVKEKCVKQSCSLCGHGEVREGTAEEGTLRDSTAPG